VQWDLKINTHYNTGLSLCQNERVWREQKNTKANLSRLEKKKKWNLLCTYSMGLRQHVGKWKFETDCTIIVSRSISNQQSTVITLIIVKQNLTKSTIDNFSFSSDPEWESCIRYSSLAHNDTNAYCCGYIQCDYLSLLQLAWCWYFIMHALFW
jgi:hypothetical protein